MKPWRALAAGAFVSIVACTTYRPPPGPLEGFEFLEGTWARTTSSETLEEVWTSSHGWSLHGVGRTLRDGNVVAREDYTIEPRGSRFVYVARLPGAAPVEFPMTGRGDSWVSFENREHDFPQRIEYRRDGNSLRAAVTGIESGRARREVIDYRRIAVR